MSLVHCCALHSPSCKTPEHDIRGDRVATLRRSEYGQRRNDAGQLVDIDLENGDNVLLPPAVRLPEGGWPGLSTNLVDRHEVVWIASAPEYGWSWENPVAQLKTSLSQPRPGHDFRYFRYRRLVEEKIPTGIALDKDEPNHVTIVVTQEHEVDQVFAAECNLLGIAALAWVPHSVVRFEYAPDTPEAKEARKEARKSRKAAKKAAKTEPQTSSSVGGSSKSGDSSKIGDGAVFLSNVCSALSTIMADTWSADLVEEAQAVLEELEDGMDDIEEDATAQGVFDVWLGVEARMRSILRDFVGSSSFRNDELSHVGIQNMLAVMTPPTSVASSAAKDGPLVHLTKAFKEAKNATDALGLNFAALLHFGIRAAVEAIEVPVAQSVGEPSTRTATDPEVPKTTRDTDHPGNPEVPKTTRDADHPGAQDVEMF